MAMGLEPTVFAKFQTGKQRLTIRPRHQRMVLMNHIFVCAIREPNHMDFHDLENICIYFAPIRTAGQESLSVASTRALNSTNLKISITE